MVWKLEYRPPLSFQKWFSRLQRELNALRLWTLMPKGLNSCLLLCLFLQPTTQAPDILRTPQEENLLGLFIIAPALDQGDGLGLPLACGLLQPTEPWMGRGGGGRGQ